MTNDMMNLLPSSLLRNKEIIVLRTTMPYIKLEQRLTVPLYTS